jgi:UDP-N-acetylglucosamine 2-epimerase
MKLAIVIGNRPHFIKCAPLLKALGKHPDIHVKLIHTGQHYDLALSGIFLTGFKFPPVDVNLEVGSAPSSVQTGRILSRLDAALETLKPDCVISMGDTNTTLAAALAAYYRHIPNAHIEAGMRENIWRPEEINKKMADHCADYLFAPLPRAVKNLQREGIESERIYLTGDITLDTFMANRHVAMEHLDDLKQQLSLPDHYDVLTLHRAETVDNRDILEDVLSALSSWPRPLIFPVHPRTQKRFEEFNLEPFFNSNPHIRQIPPASYLDFLALLLGAVQVATDSSGVLKEAFYASKSCIVLDDTTEYRELFDMKAAIMGGRQKESILAALKHSASHDFPDSAANPFGSGQAAEKMVEILRNDPPFSRSR